MLQESPPFWETLIPQSYKNIELQYDERYFYRKLHEISVKESNLAQSSCKQMKDGKHRGYFKSLDSSEVQDAFQLIERNNTLEFNNEVKCLLEKILTPEIDAELKAYFKSNYAVVFYSTRNISSISRQENPSIKWHCDGAPTKSVMVMCYLNPEEEHESSTLFLDEEETLKLKDIGYIYSKVTDRHEEIDDLLEFYDINPTIHRHSFKAGESIAFGASQVAHRAEVPKIDGTRKTIDLCIIPSPVPWQEALKKGFIPENKCVHFNGQAQRLMTSLGKGNELSGSNSANEEVVHVDQGGRITNDYSLKLHLGSIFSDLNYANSLFKMIKQNKIDYDRLTVNELIFLLKKSFRDGLNWEGGFNKNDLNHISDLIHYEENYVDSVSKYSLQDKPNKEAVMWPIPNHAKNPKSKFEMLPYVQEHKIMNKRTPIGSAGSCFAVEIAKVLQEEQFNYVVTELGDEPQNEAIIDGYKVGSGKAMYSANFGILFNTPSLKQIAEKAFNEKHFTKYLFQAENGLYMDPYRENVYFKSRENFLRDYPKHIEAIRQVLLQSEVFVFTAGLNECWELFDGTTISRNPRSGFHHLIKHRVLTVEENISNIMSFFNIVKKQNPKFKLVLTLSPVPLLATGRADSHHILEANTHSKAVLRVALEEVVKRHEDIYYLPSYELVTECMPNPWKEDHRHVTPETVSRVIEMFNNMFVNN